MKINIKKVASFLFKPEIHVLSDSHGVALKEINFKKIFGINANFCIVPGATASGLANPNSKTKAYPIFKEYVNRFAKRNDYFLIQLGEVDCGFTIWYKAKKEKSDPYLIMEKTVSTYIDFIEKYIVKGSKKIIICSAILPTIKDGIKFGNISNLRKEVKTSQIDRTRLTQEFNRKMREFAIKSKFYYLDLEFFLLNKDTGLIDDWYLNSDLSDHHPDPLKISEIYIRCLKESNVFINYEV